MIYQLLMIEKVRLSITGLCRSHFCSVYARTTGPHQFQYASCISPVILQKKPSHPITRGCSYIRRFSMQ